MNDLVDCLRRACLALVNPLLWLDLLRRLLSWRGLGFVLLCLLGIVVALAGLLFLPRIVGWIPLAVWCYWFVPAVVRPVSTVVARHVIGPMLETRDDVPADVHERDAPEPRVYRHWWGPGMVALAVAMALVPLAKGWLGEAVHVVFQVVIGIVSTGFVVRATLCTWFPLPMIEQSLRQRRWSWALLLLVVSLGTSGLLALAEAIGFTPSLNESLRGFSAGKWLLQIAIESWLGIGSAAALAAAAASRLLREVPAGPPREHATTPPHDRAPKTRRRSGWAAAVWTVGLFGAFASSWFVLGKQYAYWVLSFDADFKRAVAYVSWNDEEVQRHARTEMACKNKLFAVRLLHVAGVRQDTQGRDGLACASRMGYLDMAGLLIRLGADVNRLSPVAMPEGTNGRHAPVVTLLSSPLVLALQAGHFEIAELLLAHGARLEPASADGPAALHLAASLRCLRCVEWLRDHGAKLDVAGPSSPLALWFDAETAGAAMDIPTLERLVALGLSPSAKGLDGRSALHAAAYKGHRAAVEWLLAHGAEAASPDSAGMTPLMHAAYPYRIPAHAFDAEGVRVAGRPSAYPPVDQRERLATVLALLQHTPDLSGQARALPSRPSFATASPPVFDAGWSLALLAAREPAFRQAVREQGKSIDYGAVPKGTTPWRNLQPAMVRAAIQEMSDDEFRSALWMKDGYSGQESGGLPFVIARHGWSQELERAIRLGLVHSERAGKRDLCWLLVYAALGGKDESPERGESWQGLLMLLDAGLHPRLCDGSAEQQLRQGISSRVRLQSEQWQVRTAAAPVPAPH